MNVFSVPQNIGKEVQAHRLQEIQRYLFEVASDCFDLSTGIMHWERVQISGGEVILASVLFR